MDLKSNEPFWLVKNGIIGSYPSLKKDMDCDILIVGAGITGSLMAHQCMEDGYKTILIDKREIANGSSSATTSMLQYEIDVPLFELIGKIGKEGAIASYQACSSAIDRLAEICKLIKSKAGFKRKESLYFAALKKDLTWLKQEYEARKLAKFKVSWLDSEYISKKYEIEHTFGGILSKQGASLDAFRFVHEILEFNTKRGLAVFDKTELLEVKYHTSTNEAILQSGIKIKTKKIVYCVGYESTNLIKEKFVHLISTYAMVSEVDGLLSKKYHNLLLWNTAKPYIYFRTTDDGRLLIGGGDEPFKDPEIRDQLIRKKEKNLLKSFNTYFPKIPFFIDFSWAGTFGETKDGLPYIGTHQDFKNSYFVLGFGGNGITFSVMGMEMLSDWMKGKKHPLSKWFKFGR